MSRHPEPSPARRAAPAALLLLLVALLCAAPLPGLPMAERSARAAPPPDAPPGQPAADTPRSPPVEAEGCPEGQGAGSKSAVAFWSIGDDRDNPPVMARLGTEVARRMRCVAAARALLLHGGDSHNRHAFGLFARQALEQIAQAYGPIARLPATRLLLAPGNHEGVEGAREMRELLQTDDAATQPWHGWSSVREGPLLVVALSTEDRQLLLRGEGRQAAWLKGELARARRERLLPVLLMHRPPASLACGAHDRDSELARWGRVLEGLLDEGPGLVLAAHDHLYARVPLRGGWLGVLNGIGGAPLSRARSCAGALRLHAPTPEERIALRSGSLSADRFFGFVECQVSGKELLCQAINLRREVFDRFSLALPSALAAPVRAR